MYINQKLTVILLLLSLLLATGCSASKHPMTLMVREMCSIQRDMMLEVVAVLHSVDDPTDLETAAGNKLSTPT